MPSITYEKFNGGLDLRRSPEMTASNVLLDLKNAYITTGLAIRKRPCLTKVATLEAGTVGLRSGLGKLNTFYGGGAAITHANPLFQANRVYHSTDETLAITKAHYAQPFNGYLYVSVEFSNGDVRHAYLDDPGAWAAATAYPLNSFRRPTTPNGFRYEATAIAGTGTSGGSEPVWPTTIGATVVDNAGANQITWTCRAMTIADVNCPHTKIVRKINQKIYAAGSGDNAGNVPFCATAAPRDWTTSSDAGFIPAGTNAAGSDEVTALGDVGGDLVVFFADSTQVWDVDADPTLNVLKTAAENIGTLHRDTPAALANDLIFLAQQGFRSVSLIAITDNLQENDVGSAIDALRGEILDADSPMSIYYPSLGQLWNINGNKVYTYAFAKSVKLSAWQTYEFPVTIEAAAVLNGQLYVRSGDDVFLVDKNAYNDDGAVPEVVAEMFFQDAKQPGVLKMFTGMDGVVKGSPEIAFKHQEYNAAGTLETEITPYYPIEGDMRPGDRHPVELCSVAIAPVFRHQRDEEFQVNALMLYFEELL